MTAISNGAAAVLAKPVMLLKELPYEFPITQTPRILIVEDDPQLAGMIATVLRGVWFDCDIRRSGAQGVQAFIQDPVDLIITDLKMQSGDGIALIQTIRRTSNVPIIIVTGFAAEYADRVRFLDNVALINKPFNCAALVSMVEKALDAGNRGDNAGWSAPPSDPTAA